MGRRSRRRGEERLAAPAVDHRGPDGMVLTLRAALSPKTRTRYAETLAGGRHREDAWQRATELLFEHLAVRWVIHDVALERPAELLARYRMAGVDERRWVRDVLRAHCAEHFPELAAP